MASQPAREVKIYLHDNGVIKDVKDPQAPGPGIWDINEELPLDGEHYEWNLSPYKETGVDILHMYTSRHVAAANKESDKKHLNTVGLHIPELIKLDCGHWGGYKRWREFPNGDKDGVSLGRQREFGVIEGNIVLLCCFVSKEGGGTQSVHDETLDLLEEGAPKARRLAEVVYDEGKGPGALKVLKHAKATSFMKVDTQDKLFVIFPDLHLPERWPDLPKDDERHDNPKARCELQKWLRESQRKPGILFGSTLPLSDMEAVQKYLELIATLPSDVRKYNENAKVNPFLFRIKTKGRSHFFYTPDQFEAEKAIVDREFRLRSTWFYARGAKWKEEVNAGSKDWMEVIREHGNGDATPAIDLINFLLCLSALQSDVHFTQEGWTLKVMQVGDIYETWVNREFLYRGFWARDTKAGSTTTAMAIRQTGDRSKGDNFQYRMDARWRPLNDRATINPLPPGFQDPRNAHSAEHPPPADKNPLKRYIYHELPSDEMLLRHVVGDMINTHYAIEVLERDFGLPTGEIKRRQELLKQRLDNIAMFSLPFPKKDEVGRDIAEKLRGQEISIENYKRVNARSEVEILWNNIILDLLYGLAGNPMETMVYGNHDGYRGDWILNSEIQDKVCPGWISLPGIWFEHSHRWDPYNRDGCAFGAGAANFTYYWFNNICSKSAGKLEAFFGKQEQAVFQPGAALWFLLVNYGQKLPWFKKLPGIDDVRPFGIYVSGHTHSGDLVRLTFHTTFWSKRDSGAAADKIKSVVGASAEQRAANRDASAQAAAYAEQSSDSSGRVRPQFAWLRPR